MGKAYAFARLILLAGASEEFENSFVVLFCYAATVVLNLNPDHVTPFGHGSD